MKIHCTNEHTRAQHARAANTLRLCVCDVCATPKYNVKFRGTLETTRLHSTLSDAEASALTHYYPCCFIIELNGSPVRAWLISTHTHTHGSRAPRA